MLVIKQHRIYRSDLKANPHILYLFGDNLDREGLGGQAGEMRGEPNAFGWATKRSISHSFPEDYFFDGEDDTTTIMTKEHANLQGVIGLGDYKGLVIPSDGIGTGLSKMPEYAPKTLELINTLLETYSCK